MLSKMIVQMFQRFIEVVLWISLLGFVFAGWQYDGVTTALAAFLAWVMFACFFRGVLANRRHSEVSREDRIV